MAFREGENHPGTRQREVRALLSAGGEHPDAGLHLVTLTPESANGIPDRVTVHPACRWLLAGPEDADRFSEAR